MEETNIQKEFQKIPKEVIIDDSPAIDINELLDLAIEKEASDIHFGAESKIALRIFGEIRSVENAGVLTKEQAEKLIFALMSEDEDRKKFLEGEEVDFSYIHTDKTTFRCNAFFRRGRPSIVMRRINKAVPTIAELGLPPAIEKIVRAKQGLFLVVGPTGSGKSTTLCSILEEINQSRVEHIITVEDPVEYLFEDKKCIFSQRELGNDTLSFDNALRSAMRQDPNIVMVGEMRDRETITAALNLCETGHLVFSTLHTNSGSRTISRLAQAFPAEQKNAVLGRIADNLIGILSQRLVRKKNGGRVAVFELALSNSAVRNSIRQGDISQIDNAITAGSSEGMISLKQSVQKLLADGKITPEVADDSIRKFTRN